MTPAKTILVTGASGFVGRALCRELHSEGRMVRGVSRSGAPDSPTPNAVDEWITIESIDSRTEWSAALKGVDAVVHLAARVHQMHETRSDESLYEEVNSRGTLRLAAAAARCGVRRLVFLSTAKVNGESTSRTPSGDWERFSESDLPEPADAYALSKWQAEQGLHQIALEAGLEVVVLRPPLVYGPGVRANFLKLIETIDRGVPLPLGSVDNLRSLIYVENLASAIALCIDQPAAAGQTYLLSDTEISTPALIRAVAAALHRPARLLSVPQAFLKVAGAATGRSAAVTRLLSSLVVDSTRIRRELGWSPAYSLESGLSQTARWYADHVRLARDRRCCR